MTKIIFSIVDLNVIVESLQKAMVVDRGEGKHRNANQKSFIADRLINVLDKETEMLVETELEDYLDPSTSCHNDHT